MLDNCDICTDHRDVITLEIDDSFSINSIKDILRQIIDIYTPDEDLPSNFPHEKKDLLQYSLQKKWSIFSIESDLIYRLITVLFSDDNNIDKRLFTGLVGVMGELELEDSKLIVSKNDWDKFSYSIKYLNRFHTKTINLDMLEHFLNYTKKTIKPGELSLYRCRISNDKELSKKEMYAPPQGVASAGRLNAEWISTLYLGDDQTACIQEVRASFHDKVFIGEFVLKEIINVADLRNFEDITLDPRGDYLEHYYLNRNTLKKISNELAKPANNQDKGIHYLPLQYISDFIKSSKEGFHGILYKSVMNENANNLLLFDSKLVRCKKIHQRQIKNIDYKL